MIIIMPFNVVLLNGCFHNGPVLCRKSLIIAHEVCIGPRQCRELIQTLLAIITERGDLKNISIYSRNIVSWLIKEVIYIFCMRMEILLKICYASFVDIYFFIFI
jgi:hypothetical protein